MASVTEAIARIRSSRGRRHDQFFYERHGLIGVATVDLSDRRKRGIDLRTDEEVNFNEVVSWQTAEEQKRLEESGRIRRRNGTTHREGAGFVSPHD